MFVGWNFADHGFGMVFLVISQSYSVIIKFSSLFAPHNLPKHVPKKLWLFHGENVCKNVILIKAFQLYLQWKYRKYTFLGFSSGSNPCCYLRYLHANIFPKTNSTADMNEGIYWHNLAADVTTNQNNTQPAITCAKLTIETLDQGVKYVQS